MFFDAIFDERAHRNEASRGALAELENPFIFIIRRSSIYY